MGRFKSKRQIQKAMDMIHAKMLAADPLSEDWKKLEENYCLLAEELNAMEAQPKSLWDKGKDVALVGVAIAASVAVPLYGMHEAHQGEQRMDLFDSKTWNLGAHNNLKLPDLGDKINGSSKGIFRSQIGKK